MTSQTSDHLLHGKMTSEGYWQYRLECTDCPGTSFSERSDPSCRCEPKCECCAADDHGGCSEFGGYIDNIGYECMCDLDEGECWTTMWLAEDPNVCIFGDNWPEDESWPIPVRCVYNGDGLEIHWVGTVPS